MAFLNGRVYGVRHFPEVAADATGKGGKKEMLSFNLGTRRAFINEGDRTEVYHECVCYMSGIIKILKEHYMATDSNDPKHGKWIALHGHFNERTWIPDVNKPEHKKFIKEEVVTKEALEAVGFRFQEGSPTSFVLEVPMPQVRKEFVVTGFEFIGGDVQRNSTSVAGTSQIRIAGANVGGTPAQQPTNTGAAGLLTQQPVQVQQQPVQMSAANLLAGQQQVQQVQPVQVQQQVVQQQMPQGPPIISLSDMAGDTPTPF